MWEKLRNLLRGEGSDEAEAALVSARTDLHTALKQQREVKQVVNQLRYQREQNHFAERIRESMRGA